MEVHGLGSVGSSLPVGQTRPNDVRPEAAPAKVGPQDELTFSAEATRALDGANPTGSLREARLANIKSAIDAGTYDTDEKLELAMNKMFEKLGIASGW